MDEYRQFSAKNKNEAITKAVIELGAASSELDIVVISEGSAGFFGFGAKPAVIKARRKTESAEEQEIKDIVGSVSLDSIKSAGKKDSGKNKKPAKDNKPKEKKAPEPAPVKEEAAEEAAEKPAEEKPAQEKAPKEKRPKEKAKAEKKEKATKEEKAEEPAEEKPVHQSKPIEIIKDEAVIQEVEQKAAAFLKEIFDAMDLGEVEIKSVYNREDGSLEVDFEGDDMGVLIGKRGQTLDSLQYLTSLVVNQGKENYIRVKLDTEDYRRRRKDTLENLAKGIAYKVKKTRRPVVLEPMNPYERRIIHSALQSNKFVETISEGEEPYRHIVVRLKRN